jgi:16S rRNA (adenine1518-N6/adenine1519-N6)-dimethyltransferase
MRPSSPSFARVAPPSRRRALGQHFLRDPAIARAIVDLVAPTPDDVVVEIGPGDGALTAEVAERAPRRTLALELDPVLVARLRERFRPPRFPGLEVIEADARRWDYGRLVAPADGRVLVVGNLPYSVSKPIVAALVGARGVIAEMALMLQLEVAERLAARPGGKTYGSVSVLTQLYCDVRIAFSVPPGAFRPPPKVESGVVHLAVRPEPCVPIADASRFHIVVRAAFAQRRKMLANALAGGLGIAADAVRRVAEDVGIDPGRRAETLEIEEFARLAARL